ncbi:MAG TPA: hypothetical protein VG938_03070 [Verrucomicrobiae bacterium]|jgi:hypothetical protein|nr:hypothetical protein [Verrucomicrobiae bacterium]
MGQLDFPQATTVSKVGVYWFADHADGGGCAAPKNWQVLYKDGEGWKPVSNSEGLGLSLDQFNDTSFTPAIQQIGAGDTRRKAD